MLSSLLGFHLLRKQTQESMEMSFFAMLLAQTWLALPLLTDTDSIGS
jgi:hypothetical protein